MMSTSHLQNIPDLGIIVVLIYTDRKENRCKVNEEYGSYDTFIIIALFPISCNIKYVNSLTTNDCRQSAKLKIKILL